MKHTLRDYQSAASDAIFEAWKEHPCVLGVMATGLGKTVLAADVIRRVHPGRTMFIAHREELIFQARHAIANYTGFGCEIEMADMVASTSLFHRQDVVISTVQTQTAGSGAGRMTRFKPDEFALLVVDEVHHATATSYRKVIDYYRQNPNLKVLGITATPDRTDEEALGQIFGKVAVNFGILEGIENGWLVPISQQLVMIKELDFSAIRTTGGDLNGADLNRVMEEEKNMQGVSGAAIQIVGDRRAIVFAASVKQAEMLSDIFNRHKPKCAEWICGMTPKEARRDLLQNFAKGKTQIMCNCGVLTEGFDDPGVEVIIMARPTKSRSLYTQMVGRSTRPLPGIVDGPVTADERKAAIAASIKPRCLVVDFTGNSGRHKLVTAADILGGKHSEGVRNRAKANLEKDGTAKDMNDALAEAEEELRREREARERKERERIKARVTYASREIDPFNRMDTTPQVGATSRDGRTFSAKQAAVLRKNGYDPAKFTYGQGQAIIGKIFSKATPGQANVLHRAGYSAAEVAAMDAKGASTVIDALAKNGWKRPAAVSPVADVPTWEPPAVQEPEPMANLGGWR